MHLVRPNDKDCLVVAAGIHLSENHEKPFRQLSPEEQREIFFEMREAAFHDGTVGFGPETDGLVPTRWQLDHLIYDDGISKDAVMKGMKRVHTCHLRIVDVLNRRFSDTPSGSAQPDDEIRGYL